MHSNEPPDQMQRETPQHQGQSALVPCGGSTVLFSRCPCKLIFGGVLNCLELMTVRAKEGSYEQAAYRHVRPKGLSRKGWCRERDPRISQEPESIQAGRCRGHRVLHSEW